MVASVGAEALKLKSFQTPSRDLWRAPTYNRCQILLALSAKMYLQARFQYCRKGASRRFGSE
jgi:hypothetical protein